MVHLKVLHRPASLASPTVALQHSVPEFCIRFRIKSEPGAFLPNTNRKMLLSARRYRSARTHRVQPVCTFLVVCTRVRNWKNGSEILPRPPETATLNLRFIFAQHKLYRSIGQCDSTHKARWDRFHFLASSNFSGCSGTIGPTPTPASLFSVVRTFGACYEIRARKKPPP